MNLKQACPNRGDQTCQISCQDPTRANQCILLSSLLIDGSPCGYGGTCIQGQCQSGSIFDTAKAWYTQNLQIAIPVTIVAGLFVLAILWFIIRSISRCMARRKAVNQPRRTLTLNPNVPLQHERLASADIPRSRITSPPPMRTHDRPGVLRSRHDRSNWVDETLYNGSQRQGYN